MERVNCVSDGVTGGRVGCKRVTRVVGCVNDRVVKQVGCVCDGLTGGVGCDILTRSGVGCVGGVGCIGDRVTVTGWVEGGDRETAWIVIADRLEAFLSKFCRSKVLVLQFSASLAFSMAYLLFPFCKCKMSITVFVCMCTLLEKVNLPWQVF